MESALIAEDIDAAKHGRVLEACLNRTKVAGSVWSRVGVDDEHPQILAEDPQHTDWSLRTFEFCRPRNLEAARQAIQRARRAVNEPEQESQSFTVLPAPGSPIVRLTPTDLRAHLRLEGVRSALVVHLSDRTLSDGRAPLTPMSTPEEIAERVMRYWPVSDQRRDEVRSKPPEALIAVLGSPRFALVVAAVRLLNDPRSLLHGIWDVPTEVAAQIPQLVGTVVEGFAFKQSAYPVYWLPSTGSEPVWVGGSGSRAITAAQAAAEIQRTMLTERPL